MKIWNLLDLKQKKLFIILFIFNISIVFLELVSLSSIFPIIYSLNNDLNLLENNVFFNKVLNYLNDFKYHSVILFLSFLGVIIVIKNIILVIYNYFESKFLFNAQEQISSNLFSSLINRNYEFHLENNTADLITRVRTDGLIIRDVIYSFHASLKSIFFSARRSKF